jgi:hypothetical protein
MGKFGGDTPARLAAAAAWAGAALALSSCGMGTAVSGAMGGESKDTPEVIANAPEQPTASLDLGLDPAEVIQEGTGDSSTMGTIGWPDTELPIGEYVVHAQCRGTDRLTFSYTSRARSERMTGFSCGGPTWFNVSVNEPGYFITFSGDPAASDDVEYVFAVTKPDVVGR